MLLLSTYLLLTHGQKVITRLNVRSSEEVEMVSESPFGGMAVIEAVD